MASAFHTLRLTALRGTSRIRPRLKQTPFLPPTATFHTCIPHKQYNISFASSLPPPQRAFYDSLSPEDRERYERDSHRLDAYMSSSAVDSRLSAAITAAAQTGPPDDPPEPPERFKGGLMSLGEDDEIDTGEDEVFEGDDMSSIAHGELQQHRELREYARVAAWEMPLLSKLATPFAPPERTHPLRFRHTTYLGETHPAADKIVLEFCPGDLPLTPAQRLTLIKLCGVRYDPQRDLVRMSCEMFATQAQNKRYLGDLVDTLMAEAREGSDRFEDVPVDFRHVKWRRRLRFPEEWKVSGERRRVLEEGRRERAEAELRREEAGRLVDGVRVIEQAVRRPAVQELVGVEAPAKRAVGGARGRGKERMVR